MRHLAVVLALVAVACGPGTDDSPGPEEPLLVAAAADLQPVFTVLGADFEAATGTRITFSFGSSGQLAQQVIEGAPMDLFASADATFVDRVLDAGVGDPETRTTYAIGRIALWAAGSEPLPWRDLRDLAVDPDARIVAIANPEHAPYGRAARQALVSAGVWDTVEPRLVYGENIADTQRLAASGNADVAITALSLALAADEAGNGTWTLVDAELHAPLVQDLVVTTADPRRAEVARRFVDHVSSPQGRAVMDRFGFRLPGEPADDTPGR